MVVWYHTTDLDSPRCGRYLAHTAKQTVALMVALPLGASPFAFSIICQRLHFALATKVWNGSESRTPFDIFFRGPPPIGSQSIRKLNCGYSLPQLLYCYHTYSFTFSQHCQQRQLGQSTCLPIYLLPSRWIQQRLSSRRARTKMDMRTLKRTVILTHSRTMILPVTVVPRSTQSMTARQPRTE